MEGGETDRCVIGTLNASTMNSGRLATYLGLAEDTGVDVLCVQETRMAPMEFQGATKAARLAGWPAWFVAGGIDAQGTRLMDWLRSRVGRRGGSNPVLIPLTRPWP